MHLRVAEKLPGRGMKFRKRPSISWRVVADRLRGPNSETAGGVDKIELSIWAPGVITYKTACQLP